MDFFRPPKVSQMHKCKYIVVSMKYLMKLVEVKVLPDNTVVSMEKFIYG